jgi:hypothetical protein
MYFPTREPLLLSIFRPAFSHGRSAGAHWALLVPLSNGSFGLPVVALYGEELYISYFGNVILKSHGS